MSKQEKYLAMSGYKSAPEQFRAYWVTGFSDGNRNIPKYSEIELIANSV